MNSDLKIYRESSSLTRIDRWEDSELICVCGKNFVWEGLNYEGLEEFKLEHQNCKNLTTDTKNKNRVLKGDACPVCGRGLYITSLDKKIRYQKGFKTCRNVSCVNFTQSIKVEIKQSKFPSIW